MAGNLGLLARLRLRHLRSGARFLLFAAGADIDEDCGFLERTYQLYLVAIFAVVLALSWAQVVDLVEGTRDAMGSLAGALGMLLLAVAPSIALVCWAVAALRETPLRLTSPDIAWLSRVVRPQELLAVQLVGSALVVATVSALLGYLLGVLTRAPAPLAWCPLVASLALAARLLALVLGLARSAVLPRRRRLVTVVAGVLAALLAGLLALALPTLVFLLGWLVTFGALLLDVVIAALALWLASRSDMTFIVDDNELYAARVSLSFLAFANAGAYKEACRRRRLGRRRQARRTWHFARGERGVRLPCAREPGAAAVDGAQRSPVGRRARPGGSPARRHGCERGRSVLLVLRRGARPARAAADRPRVSRGLRQPARPAAAAVRAAGLASARRQNPLLLIEQNIEPKPLEGALRPPQEVADHAAGT